MPDITIKIEFDGEALQSDVEQAVSEGVGRTLVKARGVMRAKIPANRTKTRKYLRTKHQGKSGRVGVKFPSNSRYPKRGTKTETLMQQAWDHAEPITRDYLNDVLTDLFEELK